MSCDKQTERTDIKMFYYNFTVIILAITASVLCGVNGQIQGNGPVDIVFVIDGSASVSDSDFIKQKYFISSIIKKLDIGKNQTNVGAVVYSSNIGDIISLKPFKSKDFLLTLMRLMTSLNGGSDTAIGIKHAHQMLNENGRVNAGKIMVVFTDGRSQDPRLTVKEANLANDTGIVIFAVGVGKDQPKEFEQEVRDIASFQETEIRADDFASLTNFVTPFIELMNPSTYDKITCQETRDVIKCPALTKIHILYANYGRTSPDVCLNTIWDTSDTLCRYKDSKDIVKVWCEGQNQCYLFAVNELFTNPCYGTYKYLQVTYECLFDPTTAVAA